MNAKDVADAKKSCRNIIEDSISNISESRRNPLFWSIVEEMADTIVEKIFSRYSVVMKEEDKYAYVDMAWEYDYPPLCPICNKPLQIGDSVANDELGRIIHVGCD